MEVVASLSQGRTAAAQCGLFTHKSVVVIFEPPCIVHRAKCQSGLVHLSVHFSQVDSSRRMGPSSRTEYQFRVHAITSNTWSSYSLNDIIAQNIKILIEL